jgi:hypothetical protein
MIKPCRKPQGLFSGENFMTPKILGYFKLRHGLGYAEISQGEGFSRESPVFTVTIQPDDIRRSRSKLFHSYACRS